MRNLEMSRNLVMDIEKTVENKFSTIASETQKAIATMFLEKAPEIQKCLNGVEQNKADALIRLIAMLSNIRECTKPGSSWFSYIQVIEQDLTLFFEENYNIDLSMIEMRG
nr:MAG TPA: hypothetical protein [Caudoviricetes sp.]